MSLCRGKTLPGGVLLNAAALTSKLKCSNTLSTNLGSGIGSFYTSLLIIVF